MDPDATLADIKWTIRTFNAGRKDPDMAQPDMGEFIDLVDSLDHWISRGGFLPESWERRKRVA